MRAVVLEQFGGVENFSLQDLPIPEPKAGEVRVRLKAAGFNPVDFKMRHGSYGGNLPVVLGADFSGVVDRVNGPHTGFVVGDQVYGMAFGPCSNGSYAEYLCVPAAFIVKKPPEISFAQAAALPVAALTAYRAMASSGAMKKGDAIFIAGAGGGVGSFAIRLAQAMGITAIYTVAGSVESAQFLVQKLGLDPKNIIEYQGMSQRELKEQLLSLHGGKLFDATFDFVGGEMKRLCLEVTALSGHFATIVPEDEELNLPLWQRGHSMGFGKSLSLHFIFVGAEAFGGSPASWDVYQRHLRHLTLFIAKKQLQLPPSQVIGHLSLETVSEAHRLLEAGRVKGKLVMEIP